jgi:hypothetical protein
VCCANVSSIPMCNWCRRWAELQQGVQNAKLRETVHPDLWHYEGIEDKLSGFDACFFCLGVSSSGMREADYKRVTYDLTMAAAESLCRLNPRMTLSPARAPTVLNTDE